VISISRANNLRGYGMKSLLFMLTLCVIPALVLMSCKSDQQSVPQGEAAVSGIVTDGASGAALAGVTVTARTTAGSQNSVTNGQGEYRFSYTTDSTLNVNVAFSKSGYRDTSFNVQISTGNVSTANVVMNTRLPISGGSGTGVAATIAIVSSAPQEVSVYGVGGNETSYLTWEARDSVGLPIDAAHAVTMTYTISSPLGGNEYMNPVTATTNAQGRATTSFSAGIRSGVVQIVASATVGSRTITSSPVRVVVHSGFADQRHFSVGPNILNWPVLGVMSERNPISVLVGDIYSNPVATNTAVYFQTRAGVIMSAAFTSPSGEGTADLISGAPWPEGANALTTYGDGYHYTLASTVGQNGTIVKDSVLILWSGASMISGYPSSFSVPNGGVQVINFVVSDFHMNTLSKGTEIKVEASGAQADVAFGIQGVFTIGRDVNLPKGAYTLYSCLVSDAAPDTSYATGATVSITVTSEGNGNATTTIGGIIY
jgi:hypothetical protein